MNLFGSDAGWTLGPKDATVGIGKRVAYPHTTFTGAGPTGRTRETAYANMPITIGVDDDGVVYFRDEYGNSLAENLISQVKKQQGDSIRNILQKKCNEITAKIESIGELHIDTPDCNVVPRYIRQEFTAAAPTRPVAHKSGVMGMLFKSRRERVETQNAEQRRQFEEDCKEWQAAKCRFEEADARRKNAIEAGIYSDIGVMEMFLEENLQSIIWPRETTISMEIVDDGGKLFVDIDLPEMQDMPNKIPSVPQRGYKLSEKEMPAAQIQRLYMRHVHGIGFRILGEIFSALPTVRSVVLSACSRRAAPSADLLAEEYLYSLRVERDSWARLEFDNLKNLDIVKAFEQFDLRRSMSESGVLMPIEPFGLNCQEN